MSIDKIHLHVGNIQVMFVHNVTWRDLSAVYAKKKSLIHNVLVTQQLEPIIDVMDPHEKPLEHS